jgi:hypothetical protein
MGDGILSQNRDSIGINQFRDTVMDLRIDMIRTACKNDAFSGPIADSAPPEACATAISTS